MLTIFTALLAMATVAAQQNAEIAVSYNAYEPNFKTGEVDTHHKFVLLANANESKFFSPITEYLDSLQSTPEGLAKYNEMSLTALLGGKYEEIPKSDGNYYVVKNMVTGKTTYYSQKGIEKYYSEEVNTEWEWKISDCTKTIMDYVCLQASTNFHGREWIVWFTTDIPLINGPWKLGGLPGLILEAHDSSGMYGFVADGLQQTTQAIEPVYLADSYDKIDRESYWKAKRKFLDNTISELNVQLSSLGISISSADVGDFLRYKSREEVDFIETDY